MYKILILTGRFLPKASANGLITYNIISELKKRGHKVICIATKQEEENDYEEINGIPIYRVRETLFAQKLQTASVKKISVFQRIELSFLSFLRRLKSLTILYKFPDTEPSQTRKRLRLAKELHEKEGFDCVIGVFRPFSNVATTIRMKKMFNELLCGAYYLDIVGGATPPSFLPMCIYQKLCSKGELRAFKGLDFILMAKGGRATYEQRLYKSVNKKITYVDFPVFCVDSNFSTSKDISAHEFDTTQINLIYAGTLDKNIRNPEYLLMLLKAASAKQKGVVLHIFGQGNCGDILERYKNCSEIKIIEHGRVPHNEVKIAMGRADFVVNISNNTSIQDIVPSKIFELFATGKPIINIVYNPNDITQTYFSRHPSVCSLPQWCDVEENVQRICDYLIAEKGNTYDTLDYKYKFIENTPEYTVDIIEKQLGQWRVNRNG